ncbi:MAG: SapC family protein [Sphingomonadaceae bacterium]|uniref:SapC family protein n=1 Tax=Thermaurantiacus sp. TaxID=2820283 RepID=UPI00298EF4F0|nr:SapC family protein [Thermaurantiacus sp.]MCS6987534.1 SapC family protein [Sphingomonadaceae bacterium]MDW8415135.1 SapC family protein [Thermaurantiacus sp.]
MATQPALPLFYRNLVPLSLEQHRHHGLKPHPDAGFARATHAIPLTVDEFPLAQRHYPIVFTTDDPGIPLALVGLREGENLFVDEAGRWRERTYIPAWVRRHPFMLVRPTPDSDRLSLVFDDSWGLVTEEAENKLFTGDEPSETTRNILKFCEEYEAAIARTRSFMEELKKLGLLMDGQAQIQNPDMPEPARFSGFRMVDEQKLQNIRGDHARRMVNNGMMGLVYAHLFSLSLMRELFADLQAAGRA